MANLGLSASDSVRRIAFTLSLLVFFTALFDLFVNRLLFRAGPEVLAHVSFPGISDVAVIGAISFNLEQMITYVILGSAAFVLIREGTTFSRFLGLLLIPQLVSAFLLYLPLSGDLAWSASALLLVMTAVVVLGLLARRLLEGSDLSGRQAVGRSAFILAMAVSFLFLFYYRISLLLSSAGMAGLPFPVGAYTGGVYMVVVTSAAAFAYSLIVSSRGFKDSFRTLIKAALLPTLILAPFFYGLLQSFFMVQIFSMVIAMSTDIVLSFSMVRVITIALWFILTSVLLLLIKGRKLSDRYLIQQGIGLVLILSGSFLFNYPSYLLLSTTGVLLISVSLFSSK